VGLLTLIGDVHGDTGQYCHLARRYPRTIQLGDMGLGFKGVGLPPPGEFPLEPAKHKFIRGNHDEPEKCRRHPNYLGDYGYLPDDKLFYIAGAASIDRNMRIEGISWWAGEQLSYEDLDQAIHMYLETKPRFVISHECPQKANGVLLMGLLGPYFEAKSGLSQTRTCQALQSMLEGWAPEVWIFGHYHVNKEFYVPGFDTKFRCVAPMDTVTLDTETGELT